MKLPTCATVLFAALLAGCAAPPRPAVNISDPAQVTRAVKVDRDEFKKVTTYEGPDAGGSSRDTWILRAQVAPTWTIYQFYIVANYTGDWRFYDEAYDSDGKRLELTRVAQKVRACSSIGCNKDEHVAALLSKKYLEDHAQTGIRIQVSGRGEKQAYFLSPAYVQGFLAAIR